MTVTTRLRTACALLIAVATLSACGSDGDTVTARFVSAAPLVEGNQVKLKGIVVGTIDSLRVRNGFAEVTMTLDPEAMPVHNDATFTIRPASLLGERYVDLDRGSAGAPMLDRSRVVPISQTATNVGLDDMMNTMDDPAGEGLAMLVDTLGNGVSGNGADVDKTITGLAPNMKEIQALTAVLKNHNELLGRLVEDSEPIVGALADQDGQTLDRLVGASDAVLGVTADHQEDLERTLDKLPDTLKVGRKTLAALSDTADEATPTLDALEPFTDDLPEISNEMEDFADALDPALATSQPLLDAADELLREARRPADDLRIGSPELAATVGGTKTLVNGLTINRDKVFTFIRNWALNTNGFDGISHYWRIVVTVHPDSWTALLDMLGGGSLPALPAGAAAAKSASSASGTSDKTDSPVDVPEVVNGVTKPLTGLTDKLTGGTLLQGKKSTGDGGSTGLSKKQESGLLGFLFGGGE
jgi:phospholipid/cholesterol/gamma-HCH transport system substrate-binding protein